VFRHAFNTPVDTLEARFHRMRARQKQHDEISETDEGDRDEIPFLNATVNLYRNVYTLAGDLSSEQIWRKQQSERRLLAPREGFMTTPVDQALAKHHPSLRLPSTTGVEHGANISKTAKMFQRKNPLSGSNMALCLTSSQKLNRSKSFSSRPGGRGVG